MNNKNNMNMAGGDGLSRQPSVYSLTFDEFQNTMAGSGKDFESLNMDELLKSIWTAEETQAVAGTADVAAPAALGGQQRQGSLALPRTLSQKTVDEVWRDLISGGGGEVVAGSGSVVPATAGQVPKRQPTLGEMTLEEFLVRAGVVREGAAGAIPGIDMKAAAAVATAAGNAMFYPGGGVTAAVAPTGTFDLKFPGNSSTAAAIPPTNNPAAAALPITSSGARPYVAQQGVSTAAAGGITGFVDPTATVSAAMLSNGLVPGVVGLGGVSPSTGHLSSDGLGKGNGGDVAMVSPLPYVFGGGLRGRKVTAVEKIAERRQRRMIKNRESAARSRARKQAYTVELEAEVAKLKEQNQELQKKQEEIMEKQKNQVVEMINQQNGPKKICLRRTRTGPW